MRSLMLLAAGACNGERDPGTRPAGSDPDLDTGSESAPEPACANEVVEVSPAQGAVDVPLTAEVVFRLAETDLNAVVTVSDPNGAVDGGLSIAGPVVTWTPDTLLPDTVYDVRIDHACGSEEVSWTTRAG